MVDSSCREGFPVTAGMILSCPCGKYDLGKTTLPLEISAYGRKHSTYFEAVGIIKALEWVGVYFPIVRDIVVLNDTKSAVNFLKNGKPISRKEKPILRNGKPEPIPQDSLYNPLLIRYGCAKKPFFRVGMLRITRKEIRRAHNLSRRNPKNVILPLGYESFTTRFLKYFNRQWGSFSMFCEGERGKFKLQKIPQSVEREVDTLVEGLTNVSETETAAAVVYVNENMQFWLADAFNTLNKFPENYPNWKGLLKSIGIFWAAMHGPNLPPPPVLQNATPANCWPGHLTSDLPFPEAMLVMVYVNENMQFRLADAFKTVNIFPENYPNWNCLRESVRIFWAAMHGPNLPPPPVLQNAAPANCWPGHVTCFGRLAFGGEGFTFDRFNVTDHAFVYVRDNIITLAVIRM